MKKVPFLNLVFSIIAITLAGSLMVPTVHAESVVRINDEVSITENENIEGDFYPAAYKINVSGVIDNDINAVGGQITVNGEVGNDALLVGFKTDVHGPIGDDLRIVGYEVTIAEPVMGDVFVIGGTVDILSTASISGDLIIFGGKATIEGSVGGGVLGTVNELRIDGPIAGDVDVTVNQLTLGDKAVVDGNIHYISSLLATQALNATIGGDLVRNDPVIPVKDVTVRTAVMPVLILLFSTLVWYLVSRKSLDLVVERVLTRSLRPFLLGFVTFIFGPVAISILWVSIIGSLVGLVGLFSYILLVLLSLIALAAVLGQLLMKVFNQPSSQLNLLTLVVGAVGVILLMLLPILGVAILSGLGIITFGAMVDLLIRPKLK